MNQERIEKLAAELVEKHDPRTRTETMDLICEFTEKNSNLFDTADEESSLFTNTAKIVRGKYWGLTSDSRGDRLGWVKS